MSGVPVGPGPFFLLLAVTVAGAGVAAAMVLAREPLGAGAAVALTGLAFVGARSRAPRSPRFLLVEAVAERVVEASLLGAIAWVALPAQPRLGGAAIAALGVSYLRAYLQIRSEGLGFEVSVPAWFRAASASFLALGLLTGAVEIFLWGLVGFSTFVLTLEAIQVGRQREPR
jgi:hypothetical protein